MKNECTVFLKEKGMRIGFGGIGKGYAAERAKLLLKKKGVQSGIVNAAGDLDCMGLSAQWQTMDNWYCRSRMRTTCFFIIWTSPIRRLPHPAIMKSI